MKTNTSIKQPARLKPLHPRLTPEDRLEADLRLLHRALCVWERKNRRVAAAIKIEVDPIILERFPAALGLAKKERFNARWPDRLLFSHQLSTTNSFRNDTAFQSALFGFILSREVVYSTI